MQLNMGKHVAPRYFNTATFLSAATKERGSDPPIQNEQAALVWMDFESVAKSSVIATLKKLPLGGLARQLHSAGLKVIRPYFKVRELLFEDEELTRDLVQDIALAMMQAIARGSIAASRAVVYTWVTVVSARIAREKSRFRALSLLAGAELSEDDGDDDGPPDPTPAAGATGRALLPDEDVEDVLDVRTRLREVLFRGVPANLTSAQEVVFTRVLEGKETREIAQELGISEVAVRLRLLHARRKLAA